MGARLNLGPPAPSLADLLYSGYRTEIRFLAPREGVREPIKMRYKRHYLIGRVRAEAKNCGVFTVGSMADRIGVHRDAIAKQIRQAADRGVFDRVGEVSVDGNHPAVLYQLANG